MPSDLYGFTGTEIVNRVVSYVGNTKTDFRTYVEQTLPLAEFRYCKMHDWRFLHKKNLSLACVSGTDEYSLTVAAIGYYMVAEDVECIFDQTNGRVLRKVDLKDLRRIDPKIDDGSATAELSHYAPLADNSIVVYPKTFANITLKVDGKVTPGALSDLAQYPTVPYRYQEAFMEYVIALVLDREDDDRAAAKKDEAFKLIMADVRADLQQQGMTDLPRLRHLNEASVDGLGGGDPESAYFNWLFR